jgi:sirohydrochlorin ferrochelatase
MINRSAYLLVVHGSRNYNYARQLNQLLGDIQAQLTAQSISIPVITAYLELAPKPLHQAIISLAQQFSLQGYHSIKILPLFLSSGTHVIHDIPEQLALAKIDSPLPLELMPHLGSCSDLFSLLQSQFQTHHTSDRILLAHGSSLTQSNQELEKLAVNLQAKVAYWSIEPSLHSVIDDLISSQTESLAILPYFLFTGKITAAIEQEINTLQYNTPMKIINLPTLTQMNRFAEMIVQWMGFVENYNRVE